ncbi:galactomannan galactosyltransferase 1-like [Diospyros lotus]|uniref:galactomannan galactosyltransferase 1-like n=1 Tax=Diospyros lotus TaxID=55363 RepID=UPI002254E1CA|nr:galactomannan galactosyltransferase 1-like [Diospyros lotus]
MAKTMCSGKLLSFSKDKSYLVGSIVSFLILCGLWSVLDHSWSGASASAMEKPRYSVLGKDEQSINRSKNPDPPEKTFYDDPKLSYTFGSPPKDWDEKRRVWMKLHPSIAAGDGGKVVVVTGSQPQPCESPVGDHLLLRLFKNKVDYCRIHGCEVFYNNAFLHPKMPSVWAKLPPVRAAMVAHPEAEWVWWLDSDTVVTDMELQLPLEKYRNHNLVINGWEDMVYEKKSWFGLNTGIFLIRNCQWSMDLIEVWSSFGPLNPDHEKLAKTIVPEVKDKLFSNLDEQSALVYLLSKEKEKWGDKVYIENGYSFSGYWLEIVDRLESISRRYAESERADAGLRRRRSEKVSGLYAALRERYLKGTHDGKGGWRRPFITHFTGCQPCSGHFSPSYTAESCRSGMERALNFADNQVLRNYGFFRPDLLNSSFVSPLQFDSP